MGKPIVRDFTQGKGILKFFPYEGAACVVEQSMVSAADNNGMKIVTISRRWTFGNAGLRLGFGDEHYFQSEFYC